MGGNEKIKKREIGELRYQNVKRKGEEYPTGVIESFGSKCHAEKNYVFLRRAMAAHK